MEIKKETLQMLFDTAIHSMDFTSGCLDDEEVEALREVAVLLEVDPMLATPPEFKCKYTGAHEVWTKEDRVTPFYHGRCKWCKKVPGESFGQ